MSTYDLLLNGDVWDAQNGSRSDHWVAVQDGTIADVSPEKPGKAATERTAETILPGLCDMHVH